jgi:hypothetical protein
MRHVAYSGNNHIILFCCNLSGIYIGEVWFSIMPLPVKIPVKIHGKIHGKILVKMPPTMHKKCLQNACEMPAKNTQNIL